jgi:streptomycin 6-kinase
MTLLRREQTLVRARQGARLFPVWWNNTPAMLKVANDAEEEVGTAVMAWWDGDGAAKILAQEPGDPVGARSGRDLA